MNKLLRLAAQLAGKKTPRGLLPPGGARTQGQMFQKFERDIPKSQEAAFRRAQWKGDAAQSGEFKPTLKRNLKRRNAMEYLRERNRRRFRAGDTQSAKTFYE